MITERKDRDDKIMSQLLTRDEPGETIYFIATDDTKTFHYGEVDDNHQMETGQPLVRVYKDKQQWIDTLKAIGIEPDTEGAP